MATNLPQYGGEMKGKYKGKKSDMALKQHGGEGNALGTKSDMSLLKNFDSPGRHLGKK